MAATSVNSMTTSLTPPESETVSIPSNNQPEFHLTRKQYKKLISGMEKERTKEKLAGETKRIATKNKAKARAKGKAAKKARKANRSKTR